MELRQQADDEVQTVQELTTEESWIIQEWNTQCHTQRKGEVTHAECNHAREINVTHQRASRKWCTLQLVGTAIGKLEVLPEQVHHHHVPSMEEICQFFQVTCHTLTVYLTWKWVHVDVMFFSPWE
jgi:hypothetical protein